MKRTSKTQLIFTLAGGLMATSLATTARAQDPQPAVGAEAAALPASGSYTKETWPSELVRRPITLGGGMIQIALPVAASLSADQVGKPIGVAPDIYYGVTDDLMVGLTHSGGLCLTGKSNGCGKVYNDVGVDAVYRFIAGDLELGAHVGVPVLQLSDPFLLGLRVGVIGRWVGLNNKLGILFDPGIQLGLTKRDAGNKEVLYVPLQIAFQATSALAVGVTTAFGGPLDGIGDAYAGSLGVMSLFHINAMLDAFAQFTFDNLYGKGGGADARTLVLGANIRL